MEQLASWNHTPRNMEGKQRKRSYQDGRSFQRLRNRRRPDICRWFPPEGVTQPDLQQEAGHETLMEGEGGRDWVIRLRIHAGVGVVLCGRHDV